MQKFFKQIKETTRKVTKELQSAVTGDTILPIGNFRIKLKDQLGEGGYAFVYKAEDVKTGQQFAVKRVICGDEVSRKTAEKEVAVLKKFNSLNIIKFYGACKRDMETGMKATEYYILMELCKGSLVDLLETLRGKRLGEIKICRLFLSICRSVKVLHDHTPPIAHRDIKIENILIGFDNELKLCDFGSCVTRAKVYRTQQEISEEEDIIQRNSTQMYRAPEMVDLYSRKEVNEKVDIWALGCVLYVLAFTRHPFEDGSTLQIMDANYTVPTHEYSSILVALIKKLLTKNPKKRPSIERVIAMTINLKAQLEKGSLGSQGGWTAFSPSTSKEKRATKKPKKSKTRARDRDTNRDLTALADTAVKEDSAEWDADFGDGFDKRASATATGDIFQSTADVLGISDDATLVPNVLDYGKCNDDMAGEVEWGDFEGGDAAKGAEIGMHAGAGVDGNVTTSSSHWGDGLFSSQRPPTSTSTSPAPSAKPALLKKNSEDAVLGSLLGQFSL